MKFNVETQSWVVKGTKNFIFEFKFLDNGNIAFIRYQNGEDRKESPTNYIPTGLCADKSEKMRMIFWTLKGFTGHSQRIIQKLQDKLC